MQLDAHNPTQDTLTLPSLQDPWDLYSPSKLQILSLHELKDLSSSLQQHYAIDYSHIYHDAQHLKTLDHKLSRLSAKYLGGLTDEDDSNP